MGILLHHFTADFLGKAGWMPDIVNNPLLKFLKEHVRRDFAILELRELYFVLEDMIRRFKHLKSATALALVFIGSKIFLVGIIGKSPAEISLSVTSGLIASGVMMPLWKSRGEDVVPERA